MFFIWIEISIIFCQSKSLNAVFDSISQYFLSVIKECFITSAKPVCSCFSGTVFRKIGFKSFSLKYCEDYYKRALSIPIHQQMKKKDLIFVSNKIKDFFRNTNI